MSFKLENSFDHEPPLDQTTPNHDAWTIQNSVIIKRVTILIICVLTFWFLFSTLIYVRPIFWNNFTHVYTSPLVLSEPINETIYATPCIFEVSPPYYNEYTCNIKNIIYANNILTCPENYFCSDLDNKKVCMLNNTYYCSRYPSTLQKCLDDTNNLLGISLVNVKEIDQNILSYTFIEILTGIYLASLLIGFITMYVISYICYRKNYKLKYYYPIWFIVISIIYYVNLIIIILLSYFLLPNVEDYELCYDMNLVILSWYGDEYLFFAAILLLGAGTAFYILILASMHDYFNDSVIGSENKKLLDGQTASVYVMNL